MPKKSLPNPREGFSMTSEILHKDMRDTSIERGSPVVKGYLDRQSLFELVVSDGIKPKVGKIISQIKMDGVMIHALDKMPKRIQALFVTPASNAPFWILFTAADEAAAKGKPF